jgi:hypothetical protein
MKNYNRPRKPTQRERAELIEEILNYSWGSDPKLIEEEREQVESYVAQAFIAVFDNYITNCPGYHGKVMLVLWSDSPDYYQMYIWENGKIRFLNQAGDMIRPEISE